MLFKDFFGSSIMVAKEHDVLKVFALEFSHIGGRGAFIAHSVETLPFWLVIAGFLMAGLFYLKKPEIPGMLQQKLRIPHMILMKKYYFDEAYEFVFARGARKIGQIFWRFGDATIIDRWIVNGTARAIGWFSSFIRQIQSGYVYHYAFAMIIGVFLLITFFIKIR
jgi:NADH-quinone oxidoreductase subunit L